MTTQRRRWDGFGRWPVLGGFPGRHFWAGMYLLLTQGRVTLNGLSAKNALGVGARREGNYLPRYCVGEKGKGRMHYSDVL